MEMYLVASDKPKKVLLSYNSFMSNGNAMINIFFLSSLT